MRTHPRIPTPRPGAFSLTELLIVMVIIAVIAAIAAPRYGVAAGRYRADGVARRVIAEIENARRLAVSGSCTYSISFDNSNALMAIKAITGPVAGTASTLELKNEPYNTSIVSSEFGADVGTTIDGYGDVTQSGRVTLAAGGMEVTITVPSGRAPATMSAITLQTRSVSVAPTIPSGGR